MLIKAAAFPSPDATRLHLIHEDHYAAWRDQQPGAWRDWLQVNQFRAERNKLCLIPEATGRCVAAVAGLGKSVHADPAPFWIAAALSERLPEGTYQLAMPMSASQEASFAQGWLYGQYRFDRYRKAAEKPARRLLVSEQLDVPTAERINAAIALARDLINTPANDLTPTALADAVERVAMAEGATVIRYRGDELLQHGFNTVHAVGRAAEAVPELVDVQWGDPAHPKLTLVGKGVCFDSGGLDIKPPSGMLLMKKDMGGAACTLALAQLVMQARVPVRLRVIIPVVENAISGNAFRPGDVIKTRAGLTVEVGNTDAEGRLILCDALSLADEDSPDLLIDMATLTGAARVALGPELPALFTRDAALARQLMETGEREADPLWHLPLWSGYDDELSSRIADLNNVSSTGFSGAIIGGLYLQRFVSKAHQWVHLDLYGWNGKDRPGRPSGAEAHCVRALFAYLKDRFK